MTTALSDAVNILTGEQFINLTTFRKNGNAILTPVWFAEKDGKFYITTNADAGKAERIRNNGHVKFAPCDARGEIHGEELTGMATVHSADSATGKLANEALKQKYGLMKRAFDLLGWVRRSEMIFLELSPQ